MDPRGPVRKTLFAALLLAAPSARSMENVFILSDTVAHFERVFGVRSRVSAWFGAAGGSTLNFSYPGKANVNFRLTEPAPGVRYIDQIQVEPQGALLPVDQAAAYVKFLVDDLSRQGNVACAKTRDDQDGINAFILFSCTEKGNPAAPAVEVMNTIQTINGRNSLFVQFAPKKR